jgi:hypothetical protein
MSTGVEYNEKNKKWRAYLKIDDRKKYVGTFNTEYEAQVAHDYAILQMFGNKKDIHEDAKLLNNLNKK